MSGLLFINETIDSSGQRSKYRVYLLESRNTYRIHVFKLMLGVKESPREGLCDP